jgi:hypothetical protein
LIWLICCQAKTALSLRGQYPAAAIRGGKRPEFCRGISEGADQRALWRASY